MTEDTLGGGMGGRRAVGESKPRGQGPNVADKGQTSRTRAQVDVFDHTYHRTERDKLGLERCVDPAHGTLVAQLVAVDDTHTRALRRSAQCPRPSAAAHSRRVPVVGCGKDSDALAAVMDLVAVVLGLVASDQQLWRRKASQAGPVIGPGEGLVDVDL